MQPESHRPHPAQSSQSASACFLSASYPLPSLPCLPCTPFSQPESTAGTHHLPAANIPGTLRFSPIWQRPTLDNLTPCTHVGWQELPEALAQQRGWNFRAISTSAGLSFPAGEILAVSVPSQRRAVFQTFSTGLKQMQVTPT